MSDRKQNTGKRVLAVHDLSGFGHTSLMAIMPIMYRMGSQTAVLPSALLSSNTDYPGYRMVDFSGEMPAFIAHWKELGLRFDAIYTGFLGNPAQAGMLANAFQDLLAEDGIVLVDPVLGDAGKLYSCYDDAMITAMRILVQSADIITPNVTEAAMLVGADPMGQIDPYDCRLWAEQLCKGRTRHCVITSLPGGDPQFSRVGHFDLERESYTEYRCEYVPSAFPGTGDCFAAFLLAGLMRGFKIGVCIQAVIDLLSDAIRLSVPIVNDPKTGIALESVLDLDLMDYFIKAEEGGDR